MAEEVEMTPVASEPPKAANPLGKVTATSPLKPVLKPGLKLPPKPGSTVTLKPGLKLPPKPGATVTAMRPGLKLPPKPGATVTAMRPGLKLPPKPVIHKPGATVAAHALPKPIVPASVKPAEPVVEKPTETVAAKPVEPEVAKPVAIDQQGVGKLPTVEAQSMDRVEAAATPAVTPSPVETLKSVTQKLKGITQQIPAQAVLHKTGIIADGAMSDVQKEAQKHKTARISLSDAMGAAPVKSDSPMKTIRIRRPIDIPGATKPLKPLAKPETAATTAEAPKAAETAEAKPAENPSEADTKVAASSANQSAATITQRKTLKIARPGSVRPSKFGVKRPTVSAPTPTVAKPGESKPEEAAKPAAADGAIPEIADIPDIPPMPVAETPAEASAGDGPAWLFALSSIVQIAACGAMGALAWFLYQNSITQYF